MSLVRSRVVIVCNPNRPSTARRISAVSPDRAGVSGYLSARPALARTNRIRPKSAHPRTIPHSAGQIKADGLPGRYNATSPSDSSIARYPTASPWRTLKGRASSGSWILNRTKAQATTPYAMTIAKLLASISQTYTVRPKKGARQDSPPISKIARYGV